MSFNDSTLLEDAAATPRKRNARESTHVGRRGSAPDPSSPNESEGKTREEAQPDHRQEIEMRDNEIGWNRIVVIQFPRTARHLRKLNRPSPPPPTPNKRDPFSVQLHGESLEGLATVSDPVAIRTPDKSPQEQEAFVRMILSKDPLDLATKFEERGNPTFDFSEEEEDDEEEDDELWDRHHKTPEEEEFSEDAVDNERQRQSRLQDALKSKIRKRRQAGKPYASFSILKSDFNY
eukprot:gb/GEZN01016160.1/.p1 GENE.gb/GEZN01016160.1/~~gb/GEZN01016160.1/.p1  ORF type:complete len:249 (-),score=52.69 gb/GEZN01016160.1/:102-803(-)